MFTKEEIRLNAARLNRLAMQVETAVLPLFAEDYLREFYDFFEIKDRDRACLPVKEGCAAALCECCGDDVWRPIAGETERLFGLPRRVTAFEELGSLRDELEGPDGLAPFFFVFDLLFCEYEGFTLCFLSGTNN